MAVVFKGFLKRFIGFLFFLGIVGFGGGVGDFGVLLFLWFGGFWVK